MLTRSTPLQRRTPLRAKAPIARKSMKRSRRPATSAVERRHLGRVAGMPCLVCGSPAEVHHVVSDGFQRLTRDHQRVTPLCHAHHRTGTDAVHALGHAGFTATYGIDLLAVAKRLWAESCLIEGRQS